MIKSVRVTSEGGEELFLELFNPLASGYTIRNIEGLTPPKATVNMVKIATVDGETFNSATVAGRNIVLELGFLDNLGSIEEQRQKTYAYFPIRRRVTLVIETDRRTAMVSGIVESNEPVIFSEDETTKISILCGDAWLYDASENGVVTTDFFYVDKAFEFPLENRSLTEKTIELGSITRQYLKEIYYAGDISTGLTAYLDITGDVGDLSIFDVDRNEALRISSTKIAQMTGLGLSVGDRVIINTRENQKSVVLIRNGVVINIMNAFDRTSTWLRFYKGANHIGFGATYGLNYVQLKIESQILYEGV